MCHNIARAAAAVAAAAAIATAVGSAATLDLADVTDGLAGHGALGLCERPVTFVYRCERPGNAAVNGPQLPEETHGGGLQLDARRRRGKRGGGG